MADIDAPAQTGQVRSGKMTALRPCVVVNVLLGISCLTLVGVVGWLVYEKNFPAEKSILERFPGLFRTEEERAQVERGAGFVPVTLVGLNTSAGHNQCVYKCDRDIVTNGSTTTGFPNTSITTDIELGQCPINSSSQPVTYNACCITEKGYIKPNELPSAVDKNVTFKVVQLPKRKLFQFFSVQECCQSANCASCKCTQTNYVVTALVERPNESPGFELVLVPGCCQCQNLGQ